MSAGYRPGRSTPLRPQPCRHVNGMTKGPESMACLSDKACRTLSVRSRGDGLMGCGLGGTDEKKKKKWQGASFVRFLDFLADI